VVNNNLAHEMNAKYQTYSRQRLVRSSEIEGAKQNVVDSKWRLNKGALGRYEGGVLTHAWRDAGWPQTQKNERLYSYFGLREKINLGLETTTPNSKGQFPKSGKRRKISISQKRITPSSSTSPQG